MKPEHSKSLRLRLSKHIVRNLTTELARVRGGQSAESELGPCVSRGCQTYKEITCASDLPSCITQPTYCQ